MGFAQHYLKQDQNKLEKLFFHNKVDTFTPVKGVVAVALKLAIIYGVSYTDRSYERIGLASALYNIGNIVQRQLHEQISIDDSREMLFELKYDEEMISGIASCIKSTEIDYSKGCPKREVHSRGEKNCLRCRPEQPVFFRRD